MHKKYIIFGAGNNAAPLIRHMREHKLTVAGIVDNQKEKWGSEINGITVGRPDELAQMKNEYHILISVSNISAAKAIMSQLNRMGYQKERDFSYGADLFPLGSTPSGYVSGYVEVRNKEYDAVKSFDRSSFLICSDRKREIFRVINPGYEEKYMEVYEKCRQNALFDQYIVPTNIVENVENLPSSCVFAHEFITPITYCFEWSPDMVRDYVKFMIAMIRKLAECGMCLCDGHMLNATVYGGKFCFIDFGAIDMGVMKKNVLIEFLDTHILTLILILKGELEKAYLHMKNPGITYTPRDVQGYLFEEEFDALLELYECVSGIEEQSTVADFMLQIEKFVCNIQEETIKTRWEGYQNDEWDWSEDTELWSEKMKTVMSMIRKIHPKTVIDLAGNMGWYGSYLHDEFEHTVVVDYDCKCVDSLWRRVQEKQMKNVFPVYMSVCAPTLDYYRDEMIQGTAIKPWRENAVERFGAELVIALAIVHHLAFAQQLTFDEIIGQFSLFSRKYLIVEFIEQSDQYIEDFLKDRFKWYTKDFFELCLQKRFEILETGKSTPAETRTIYLCKKRAGVEV